jgi:hypothetical protein
MPAGERQSPQAGNKRKARKSTAANKVSAIEWLVDSLHTWAAMYTNRLIPHKVGAHIEIWLDFIPGMWGHVRSLEA